MLDQGFDGQQYIQLQKEAILERMSHFSHRLYLEVGGKFLYDGHAQRVLPGFDPTTKEKIFHSLIDTMDIIFCVKYDDIVDNRQLVKDDIDYTDYVIGMLDDIATKIGKKPFISCNKCPHEGIDESVTKFLTRLQKLGYQTYKRYMIPGYPQDTKSVLSKEGYGYDEYIPCTKPLVLVTGAASNSGKMSTCLGQIYQEDANGEDSGYAKYETFPIWNIPLKHPINLAYEAATADIGDYNTIDLFHEKAYGIQSVNYNRDVDAFPIVKNLADSFLPESNYMRSYQSPTDMGVNKAGFCITDENICCQAALVEIRRRKEEYQSMLDRGDGEEKRIKICDELEKECIEWIEK